MSSKAPARPEHNDQSAERDFPKRHPLLSDGWVNADDPEWSTVGTHTIADLTRAGDAIRTIARIVHNSLGEPDCSGAQPLGKGVEMSLCEAMMCLGGYIFEKTERMRESAALHWQFEREREANDE